jgi:hypothetical protein
MLRFRLLATTLIAGSIGLAVPAHADGLGPVLDAFGVTWGQSVEQVQAALPADMHPRRLDRPLDYGPLVAPLVMSDYRLAGSRFFVYFQFERAGGKLRQILVQRRRADGEVVAYETLLGEVLRLRGQPVEHCPLDRRAPIKREGSRWTDARSTVRLVLFDYRVPGIITESEPVIDDPDVPWYKRQALDESQLPVRVLLRITAPTDVEPGC